MSDSESRLYCQVNPSLGRQPSLGPIPANLLAPSGGIFVGFYILIEVLLGLGFVLFLLLSIWGISTWWVVVGEKTWLFTHKFVPVPDWKRGHVPYQRHLPNHHE
ncbi:hypothetical protein C8255_02840 [filamentous cyanobacterium CCP3]|nr:hypothetical protein C8255_02840 [filamentous cyanobacterium CCP3]